MSSSSAYATDADLILWYPGLASVDPALRAAVLAVNECQFDACAWGCNLLQGSIQLAAHVLTMAGGGPSTGAGGQVTSKSMGPVSIGYASPPTNQAGGSFTETAAGRQYLALRDLCGPMAFSPSGGDCDQVPAGCGCLW